MKETTELLETRVKRREELEVKARQNEDNWESRSAAEKKRFLDEIKANHPEQYAEFSRLKKLRDAHVDQEIDAKLHWLLMDMLYVREWNYPAADNGLFEWLPDYLDNEKTIIHEIANKYYESLEKKLWMGKKVKVSEDRLIRLIEEAGVDTFERQEDLLKSTTILLDERSRLYDQIYGTPEWFHDQVEDLPEELQF